MPTLLTRLRKRLHTAANFAAAAEGTGDWWMLALAGIARERPFGGTGLYARLGRALGRNVTPRLRRAGGARLSLDLTDVTDLMILEEIFIDRIYPLEAIPFAPDTIVDCGACAGFFSLLAHARFPNAMLHVFEPEPGNLLRLRRNFGINHLVADVHPVAVGLHEGMARFSGRGFGGHLTTTVSSDDVEVPVIDFPRFLRVGGAERLLLKMDIEGAEAELLPALSPVLPRATALLLETHHPEDRCRRYLQPLLDSGFSQTVIRRRHDEATLADYVERLLLRN